MAFDSVGTTAAKSDVRLDLSLALSDNENTRPLLDGEVSAQGIRFLPTAVHPSEMFWRQLRYGDFDVSEMSLSSLIISASQGAKDWLAIPVFASREFYHTRIIVRADANIREPVDLRGKRVGVPEYQQTAAIWSRMALASEFGVQPNEIEWFMERNPEKSHGGATAFKPPEGVTVNQIPATKNIGEMMLSGELDATLLYLANRNLVDRSRVDLLSDRRMKYLFADRAAEGRRYYAKTNLYPINHTVVIRRALVERHPWAALNVYHAFVAARAKVVSQGRAFLRCYEEIGLLGEEAKRVMGADPMEYGMRANRQVIEAICRAVHEQPLISQPLRIDEIFTPSTLEV
jgi:4,5-dihydroxyphthalate decarboxylase